MRAERRLAPLAHWNIENDDNGRPLSYTIETEVEDFDVVYEIRRKNTRWHPKITADKHVTFRPLKGFDTAEDAHAALLKRCGML